MNKTFAFRQRAGHLNWKLISSVDIFRIVDDLRIDELQSVLDPVAFCEFSVSDVKRNTVDATTKLVHLMQLMIEYLLYCQESQLQLVKEMDGQNRILRKSMKACSRDNLAFREDIKIYKRQLALLKQALHQGADYGDQISYRVLNPPISPEQIKPILEPICAMIESVQRHEKETRDFMKSTLDEQRTAMQKVSNAENIPPTGEMWDSEQLRLALKKQRKDLTSDMRRREEELDKREERLIARENDLFAEEIRLKGLSDASQKQKSTGTSIGLNTSASLDRGTVKKLNARFVAMNFLQTTLKSSKCTALHYTTQLFYGTPLTLFSYLILGFYKSINKYFLRWKMTAWHDKIEELGSGLEECRGELYAASIRETRLKALMASERQHNILDAAKRNKSKPSQ
jgi:hypothetical protein